LPTANTGHGDVGLTVQPLTHADCNLFFGDFIGRAQRLGSPIEMYTEVVQTRGKFIVVLAGRLRLSYRNASPAQPLGRNAHLAGCRTLYATLAHFTPAM